MPAGKEDREHWDQEAQTYDDEYRDTFGQRFENEMRSWLVRQFTDADNVLELGCGTGIFSAMIAERVKHLTATDFSPEMLKRAAQRLGGYANVEVRTEDAGHTSFADDSFSAVLAANLLHHADSAAAIMRECRRILAPGGRAVIIDCVGHGRSFWSWLKMALGRLRGRPAETEDHHHFSPDDLAALLAEAGFVVQEQTLIAQRRRPMRFMCIRAVSAT
jgi:ubiquinone/menaquinone biosynthesis C-methylase UbiE